MENVDVKEFRRMCGILAIAANEGECEEPVRLSLSHWTWSLLCEYASKHAMSLDRALSELITDAVYSGITLLNRPSGGDEDD